MIQKQAKCKNVECGLYNKVITVSDGDKLLCGECDRNLEIILDSAKKSGGPPWRIIAPIVGLLLLAVVGGAILLRPHDDGSTGKNGKGKADGQTNGDGQKGDTLPPPQQGDILMYYERSAEKWLKPAAEEYNKTLTGSRIFLNPIGSYEGKNNILYQKSTPVLWNPAESYWVDKLDYDWGKNHNGATVIGTRSNMLRTHFVLAMWEDRARVFEAAMHLPKYRKKTWKLIHDLAVDGWYKQQGGKIEWGKLKWIHSTPIKSSSGLLTLGLMLDEYRRDGHPAATSSSADFLKYMRAAEDRLVGDPPDTTSKTIKAFVESGPDNVDMVVAYEQNAIDLINGELLKNSSKSVRIVYPDPVLLIKFPIVVLKADWVKPEQARVADAFIQYLLKRETQEKAVKYGFYPEANDLQEAENNNLDTSALKEVGFRFRPESRDIPVTRKELEDLQFQWDGWFKNR